MKLFYTEWKTAALILSSVVTAYSMLRINFAKLKQRQHRNKIVRTARDIDPEIEAFARQRLQQQGYDNAQIIPLKVFDSEDDTLTISNVLDCCIGFSELYEKKLKKILSNKRNGSLSHEKKLTLEDFNFGLDHEMFHIQNHHDQQGIYIRLIIPCITELAAFPLLIGLATISNPLFICGVVLGIFCKRFINTCLEIIHARFLEKKAEVWAINKNNNRESLKSYIEWHWSKRNDILFNLIAEQAEEGKSSSRVLPLLIKLFNSSPFDVDIQRLDTDDEYAQQCYEKIYRFITKLSQQPYQWPLRFLSFEYDPRHPDSLDMVHIAQDHLDLLEGQN